MHLAVDSLYGQVLIFLVDPGLLCLFRHGFRRALSDAQRQQHCPALCAAGPPLALRLRRGHPAATAPLPGNVASSTIYLKFVSFLAFLWCMLGARSGSGAFGVPRDS